MFKHGKQLTLVDRNEAVTRCESLRSVEPGMSLGNESKNSENRNGTLNARRVQ